MNKTLKSWPFEPLKGINPLGETGDGMGPGTPG